MLTGELKDLVVEELSKMTSTHQRARAQVTEEVHNLVLRLILNMSHTRMVVSYKCYCIILTFITTNFLNSFCFVQVVDAFMSKSRRPNMFD
jgi:hypothetical protein